MKLPKDRELGCGQVAEVEGRFKWFQMNTMKKGYRPIRTNVTWLKYFDGWLASSIQHDQRINVLWDQGVTAQLADIYIYIFIFIFIHIYIHTHTYIYIYTHECNMKSVWANQKWLHHSSQTQLAGDCLLKCMFQASNKWLGRVLSGVMGSRQEPFKMSCGDQHGPRLGRDMSPTLVPHTPWCSIMSISRKQHAEGRTEEALNASHWPTESCAEAVCEPVTHFSGNYFIMTRKINEVRVVSGLPHAGSTGEWSCEYGVGLKNS